MPNYRRANIAGGCYFFTVVLADRQSSLLSDRIDLLRDAIRTAKRARPFRVDAVVVLPDHLHCIWTLPFGDAQFAIRWAHIKGVFSRNAARGETICDSRAAKRERGIWQRRFWEHAIRDEANYSHHLDYIHYNPVKHGWSVRPAEWPYSSFRRYVDRGAYPLDWRGPLGGPWPTIFFWHKSEDRWAKAHPTPMHERWAKAHPTAMHERWAEAHPTAMRPTHVTGVVGQGPPYQW
jgi:REP-associated tyrosine transposase